MNPAMRRTIHNSNPTVTRQELAIRLCRLISTTGDTYSAFAIDPSGKATVSTDDGRLEVMEPDIDGRYDLAPAAWAAAAAQAS